MLESVLAELAQVAGHLWDLGWAEAGAGNVSIDVTAQIIGAEIARGSTFELERPLPRLAGRRLIVTATGSRFRDLARNPAARLCLLEVCPDGGGYRCAAVVDDAAALRATSELTTHLQVHSVLREKVPEHPIVLHSHPTHLTALSHLSRCAEPAELNRLLWSVNPEVKVLAPHGATLLPYLRPGSDQLGAATARAIRSGADVVLWRYHGCVAHAHDAATAVDRIHVLDKAARTVLLCLAAGEPWDGLDEAELAEIARAFGPHKGP